MAIGGNIIYFSNVYLAQKGSESMSVVLNSYFFSEVDALRVSMMTVVPETEDIRGIVQLVHGMCENKERYLPFMEYLAMKGYISVIHDHRGHGQTAADKNDLGYMNGAGAEGIVRDILSVNLRVRDQYPGLPVVLFGHSMGSLAVRAFASRYDDHIDMLIISGTPADNPGRALGELIAGIDSRLFGDRHRSRLLLSLTTGSYGKRFRKTEGELAWLSKDPEVVKAYEESDYCGFPFTDDGYKALFQLMKQAYDVRSWHCTNPGMPVLFVSGEEDPCMENIRRFSQAVKAMRKAGYQDVRGKIYKGMRHEILNEIGHEKVFADIAGFIKRYLQEDRA